MAYRTGSVAAYFMDFERRSSNVVGGTTFPFDIYCQQTDASWTAADLKWTTAPPPNSLFTSSQERKWQMVNATSPASGTWGAWEMSDSIIGAIRGSYTLGMMLYGKPTGDIGSPNESGDGWAYFAKKEYATDKAAQVVHAWTYPTPYQIVIAGNANGTHAISVILNGLGIGDSAVAVTYTLKYTQLLNPSGGIPSDPDIVIYANQAASVTALNRVMTTRSCPNTLSSWSLEVTVSCNGVTLVQSFF